MVLLFQEVQDNLQPSPVLDNVLPPLVLDFSQSISLVLDVTLSNSCWFQTLQIMTSYDSGPYSPKLPIGSSLPDL